MATIAENLQTILDIKNDIKDAIIAKGVSVADSDGFATYPSKIESIETSGGTTSDVWVLPDGINFSNNTFTSLPATLDLSNLSSAEMLFYSCSNLTTINIINPPSSFYQTFSLCNNLENVNIANSERITNMSFMLTYCKKLPLSEIEKLDTSNVTDMSGMFMGCTSLTTIPLFDTSKVTDMSYMFDGCSSLTTIPLLNTSNVKRMYGMFMGCTSLQSLPLLDFGNVTDISTFFGSSNITTLTELGGFKNLKIDWNDNYGLIIIPNLTYESVMNVINNLYDFPANDSTETRTIKFNANSKTLLSDEDIAIATNKGWTIS